MKYQKVLQRYNFFAEFMGLLELKGVNDVVF